MEQPACVSYTVTEIMTAPIPTCPISIRLGRLPQIRDAYPNTQV